MQVRTSEPSRVEWFLYLFVLSTAQPIIMRAPAGPVLTTSDVVSGQQYVLTSAVAVQLRDAIAPVAAETTKKEYFIVITRSLVERFVSGEE